MPADTPDQQITEPIGTDTANNPLAFNQFVADVQPRLVRQYTTEADRTARMLSLAENQISTLSTPTVGLERAEIYDGTNHVSLHTRALYAFVRKTADETISSNAVLQNDDQLLIAVPTAGVFCFDATIFYTSGNTPDIKFAFTVPAGATVRWGILGLASGATTSTGDVQVQSQAGSGSSTTIGGANATTAVAWISGMLSMGGTAGTFQLQWAQATSDASNTTVNTFSNIRMWRAE